MTYCLKVTQLSLLQEKNKFYYQMELFDFCQEDQLKELKAYLWITASSYLFTKVILISLKGHSSLTFHNRLKALSPCNLKYCLVRS